MVEGLELSNIAIERLSFFRTVEDVGPYKILQSAQELSIKYRLSAFYRIVLMGLLIHHLTVVPLPSQGKAN